MVPAALALEERNKRESTFIIEVHNRLSATDMLEGIVNDLRELERGIMMYDEKVKKNALVIAPLNIIIADNNEHANLACHKGWKCQL